MFRSIPPVEALNSSNPSTLRKALKSKNESVQRIAKGRYLITLTQDYLDKYANSVLTINTVKARISEITASSSFEGELWSDYVSLDQDLVKIVGEFRGYAQNPMNVTELANILVSLRNTIHAIVNLYTQLGELFVAEIERNSDSEFKDEIIRKLDTSEKLSYGHEIIENMIDALASIIGNRGNLVITRDKTVLLTPTAFNALNTTRSGVAQGHPF